MNNLDLDIDQMKRRHNLLFEKKNPLIIEIDEKFGKYFWNTDFVYTPTLDDLYTLFDIVNRYMFLGRLPKMKIKFGPENDNGVFGSYCSTYIDQETGKIHELDEPFITIIDWGKDNLSNVLDILCHEMIHAYDDMFGPAKKYRFQKMKIIDGVQYLGTYNVHGDYFLKWVYKFQTMEIPVSVHAKKKCRYFMNRDQVMSDSEKISSNTNVSTVEINDDDSPIVKFAKSYFNGLESEEYVGVTVDGNKMYVVIE